MKYQNHTNHFALLAKNSMETKLMAFVHTFSLTTHSFNLLFYTHIRIWQWFSTRPTQRDCNFSLVQLVPRKCHKQFRFFFYKYYFENFAMLLTFIRILLILFASYFYGFDFAHFI